MIESLLIFIFSLFLVIKGATLATKYSARLAENFGLAKYLIGFIVVAFISILPETLVAINSAIRGVPAFGLGTLFGSNVADLTLILALLILCAGRGIKIESKILENVHLYPFFLLLPLVLGSNGHYSQIEGAGLLISGGIFYYLVFKKGVGVSPAPRASGDRYKNLFFLMFAMILLLVGSYFTVSSSTSLAQALSISPILIGLLVVSLGTTMPEFFYSLKAVREREDGLAIGDILGTVLADATIVVGLLAFISPFYFPVKIIYITGAFMVVASFILFKFMRSGRTITKKEGSMLLAFWLIYTLVEFILNR